MDPFSILPIIVVTIMVAPVFLVPFLVVKMVRPEMAMVVLGTNIIIAIRYHVIV